MTKTIKLVNGSEITLIQSEKVTRGKGFEEYGVRGMKIESGTGLLLSKEQFVGLFNSDMVNKITNNFDLIIKNADQDWISVQFRDKNDTSDWNRFADLTDSIMSYINMMNKIKETK